MAFEFKKATKYGGKVRLALVGPAGSGKTYTALSVGTKLGAKVAVIDTEHGSASKYAKDAAGNGFEFDTLELTTHSPETFTEAILAAEAQGFDVIIIDSLSHAWMGKDGALELVDKAAARSSSKNTYTAWRDVTPLQVRLMDTIIGCGAHVIATMRSKTEYALEERNGKKVPVKVGMAPIQRDGTDFEFDVVGEMTQDNKMLVTKTRCSALNGAMIDKPGAGLATTLLGWVAGEPPPVKAQPDPKPAVEREDPASLIDGKAAAKPQDAPKAEKAILGPSEVNALRAALEAAKAPLDLVGVWNDQIKPVFARLYPGDAKMLTERKDALKAAQLEASKPKVEKPADTVARLKKGLSDARWKALLDEVGGDPAQPSYGLGVDSLKRLAGLLEVEFGLTGGKTKGEAELDAALGAAKGPNEVKV